MNIIIIAGLYLPTTKQISDKDLLLKFEQAKSILNEAIPNCDYYALYKEWRDLIHAQKAIIVVAEKDNKIIGVLMGTMVYDVHTKKKVFIECHWYTLKEHRHIVGPILYKRIIELAKVNYCREVIFNCNPTDKSLIKFYREKKFKQVNSTFKKEV